MRWLRVRSESGRSTLTKEGSPVFENLPESPAWRWELGEHWKGAILPLPQLEKLSDSQTEAIIHDFTTRCFD